jgi:hypothetical protein
MELAVPPAGAGHFSATTDSSRRSNRPHLGLLWGSLDRRSEEEYRKHGQVARTSTTREARVVVVVVVVEIYP